MVFGNWYDSDRPLIEGVPHSALDRVLAGGERSLDSACDFLDSTFWDPASWDAAPPTPHTDLSADDDGNGSADSAAHAALETAADEMDVFVHTLLRLQKGDRDEMERLRAAWGRAADGKDLPQTLNAVTFQWYQQRVAALGMDATATRAADLGRSGALLLVLGASLSVAALLLRWRRQPWWGEHRTQVL